MVRQALRAAIRREPLGEAGRRVESIRAASRHAFPTGDIDEILADIERLPRTDGQVILVDSNVRMYFVGVSRQSRSGSMLAVDVRVVEAAFSVPALILTVTTRASPRVVDIRVVARERDALPAPKDPTLPFAKCHPGATVGGWSRSTGCCCSASPRPFSSP
jgi:hypothetical protein